MVSLDDGQVQEPQHVVNTKNTYKNTLSIVAKEGIIYSLILRATGCITLK
jgi:hypothetical protein